MKRKIVALLLVAVCMTLLLSPAVVQAETGTAMTKWLADYFRIHSYLTDDTRVWVVIRLDGAPAGEELANLVLQKMKTDNIPYYEARKAVLAEAFLSIEEAFVDEYIYDDQYLSYYTQCDVPTIVVEVTKACILELSKSDRVLSVDLHISELSLNGTYSSLYCYYGMDEELHDYIKSITSDNQNDPVTVKIELNAAPAMEELQVLVRERLKDYPQPITAEFYDSLCSDVLREAYLPVVEDYAKNTLDRRDVFAGKYEYSEDGVGLYLHTIRKYNLELRSLLSTDQVNNKVKLLSRVEDVEFTPITVEYDQASSPADLASGTFGSNIIWNVNADGVLTVSGTGDMPSGTENIAPWLAHAEKISSIWVEDGITGIRNGAFAQCVNAEEVQLPDSLTGIGGHAFDHCKGLREITIPKNVNSIGDSAFSGCVNLERILANEGNVTYTSVDGVLFSKDNTALLAFPGGRQGTYTVPSGVKTVEAYAFEGCQLEEIQVPATVKKIRCDAFVGAEKLNRVVLLGDKPELVTDDNAHDGFLGVRDDLTFYYKGGTAGWAGGEWSGHPLVKLPTDNPFIDVPEDKYYTEAVLWALDEGVTSGKTPQTFAPDDSCTRAQVVTFLWRAMGSPEPRKNKNPFVDVESDHFYYKAVLWAAENHITSGVDDTRFAPNKTVTRGEFVTFLWRAMGEPASSGSSPFGDVSKERFYCDAVLWAAQTGITTGTAPGTFHPGDSCTRGQVVTFLYRAFGK